MRTNYRVIVTGQDTIRVAHENIGFEHVLKHSDFDPDVVSRLQVGATVSGIDQGAKAPTDLRFERTAPASKPPKPKKEMAVSHHFVSRRVANTSSEAEAHVTQESQGEATPISGKTVAVAGGWLVTTANRVLYDNISKKTKAFAQARARARASSVAAQTVRLNGQAIFKALERRFDELIGHPEEH